MVSLATQHRERERMAFKNFPFSSANVQHAELHPVFLLHRENEIHSLFLFARECLCVTLACDASPASASRVQGRRLWG